MGVRNLAIPRIAEPAEITRLVLFVASDEASFSTGSEFIADGGQLLGPAPQHQPRQARPDRREPSVSPELPSRTRSTQRTQNREGKNHETLR